jgi:hypothetical protein
MRHRDDIDRLLDAVQSRPEVQGVRVAQGEHL